MIHGVMTWQGYQLPLAVPAPHWVEWLESFTGLPYVRAAEPELPILCIQDEVTAVVDGVAWPPFRAPEDLRAWLFLTVSDVMVMRGEKTVLHAAAFQHGGRVVLLSGNEWSGKSTLAAAALAAGHELLGDDQVLFGPDGLVYALPRPVKCRITENGRPLPEVPGAVRARLGEERVLLLPRRSGPYSACDQGHTLGPLIQLQRHAGPGVEVTPLSRFEALQCALNQTRAYSLADPLADAARQAAHLSVHPAYRVSVGDHETAQALDLVLTL